MIKTESSNTVGMQMFTVALLMTTKGIKYKQSKLPLTDQETSKVLEISNGMLFSQKRNEVLLQQDELYRQSRYERSQTKGHTVYDCTYMKCLE